MDRTRTQQREPSWCHSHSEDLHIDLYLPSSHLSLFLLRPSNTPSFAPIMPGPTHHRVQEHLPIAERGLFDSAVYSLPSTPNSALENPLNLRLDDNPNTQEFYYDIFDALVLYLPKSSNVSAQDTVAKVNAIASNAANDGTSAERFQTAFWTVMFKVVGQVHCYNHVSMRRAVNLVMELKKLWPRLPWMRHELHDRWQRECSQQA